MGPYFFANWKMNKVLAEAQDFCEHFKASFKAREFKDVGIAPPITALQSVSEALLHTRGVMVGVQNVHWQQSGAHTGEVSVPMVRELSAEFAIIGHSERRQLYGESNENVSQRAQAALSSGLKVIVCIGETEAEYQAQQTEAVCQTQLEESLGGISDAKNLFIAYEPIWAIGTGLAATPEIASGVHEKIRRILEQRFPQTPVPILYGGSVKPDNISELLAADNIDGALIGGASLDPESFLKIIELGRDSNP